jgi:nucleoside-diphosphate-sugar epimerase
MTDKILVIGACGQLGTELTEALYGIFGKQNVIASDISAKMKPGQIDQFELLDVLEIQRLAQLVDKHSITQIYHLAAMLSATGEKNPKFAWKLNINGLLNVLEVAAEKKLDKIYFPSSIAVFGPNTPPDNTPQHTVMDPNTVYGISKQAGERWCEYYFNKYELDVRSLRYPGLISYKTLPGGGTTDYAVEIYHKAIENLPYTCFLSENTYLPMMYMPDGIRATLELMEAESHRISIRSSYNLAAMSFSPEEIAASIQKLQPDFQVYYEPDFRQQIADSWPNSIDDSQARHDWHWQPAYSLDKMTQEMLVNLKKMNGVMA